MGDQTANTELQEILRRAREGDEFAWRQVVDQWSGRVFGLIRSQCGNADLAEEITQSTFCTVAAKLADYDELGRFEPWLFRIAMNRLRDEMRRRKRHATSVEGDALAGMAGAAPDDPHQDPLNVEDVEISRLREAMADLSEADRQVMYLRHSTGLSFRRIGEVLDEPLGTVLARHHRALQRLKSSMNTGLEGDDE